MQYTKTKLYLSSIITIIITFFILITLYSVANINKNAIEELKAEEFFINKPYYQTILINQFKNIQDDIFIETRILIFLLCFPTLIASYFLTGNILKPLIKNLRDKEEFSEQISHELKTPITNLKLELENLSYDYNIKQKDKNSLNDELLRIENTIESILRLVNVDKEEAKQTINITDIFNELDNKFRNKIKNRELIFINKINQNMYLREHDIFNLISILIENAIKYSKNNTTIKILAYTHNKQNKISVSNQGKKISQKDFKKMFNKYERLGEKKQSGSGLGLYIAKKIINKNGYKIKLDNSKNTNFIITLK